MAVMQRTVERAKRILAKRGEVFERVGGPYPPAAMALFLARETGDASQSLTSQLGFWEVGATMRTVDKVTGEGTAKRANVNPLDRVSSYYGAQDEFYRNHSRWVGFLRHEAIPFPDAGVSWLTLYHLPYSVGWREAQALVLAGRRHGAPGMDVIDALRECLRLSDIDLPDYGPQSDALIRRRVSRALGLVDDIRRVGNMVHDNFGLPPIRIPEVKAFPVWTGPRGLRAKLVKLAQACKLDD